MPAVLEGRRVKTGTIMRWLFVTAAVIWILPLWLTLRIPVSGVPAVGNAAELLLEMTYAPQLIVSKVIPPIWRLLSPLIVASSVRIGLAAPPMVEFGMGALNVVTSLLTVLPVRLRPPGSALPTQLFMFVQVASTGALVHIWLAAFAVPTVASKARLRSAQLAIVCPGILFPCRLYVTGSDVLGNVEGSGVFIGVDETSRAAWEQFHRTRNG